MIKRTKNKLFFILILSISVNQLLSQNSPYTAVSIASPNAASLGKYADIPVSYHTGIPQINIPVYTATEGSVQLPISLSYHASGIKVMEPAGWVGAGWTLNAGGVITRTVKGAADEKLTSRCNYGHFSDYGYSNYFTTGPGTSISNNLQPDDNQFKIGDKDGEPDLFFFNFGGYSGKFYFRDDRTPVLVPGTDLKIEYYFPADNATSVTALTANIQGFIITTPDGNKYHFGSTSSIAPIGANPIEITFPFTGSNSTTDRVISSWYLSKIVSADGMFTVNLTYQAESYSYYTTSMFPVDGNASPGTVWEYALMKIYVDGVRLSQISTSQGVIDFIPGTTARTDLGNTNGWTFTDNVNTTVKPLGSINISNNGTFCKKFQLSYSYFTDNSNTALPGQLAYYSIETDKIRLKLDSLTELSCDGSIVIPAHKFTYYSNFLPRRLSFAQDHWGFYNGITTNATLIPTYSVNTYNIVTGANRDSKWPEMQHGALTKITYPTGGSTTFEFEPNTTWVNATVHNLIQRGTYSVGWDGNSISNTSNVSLTANHYSVKVTNGNCPTGNSCTLGVYIQSNDGSITYPNDNIATPGGQSITGTMVAPSAGTYRIHLQRDNTYPGGTGGEVTFTEIVPTLVQSNTTVGGLRVKTITSKDAVTSNDMVTSYSYDVNGQSSGILYSRPRYVQIIRNDILAQHGYGGNTSANPHPNGCVGVETYSQPFLKSPNAIIPMAATQGNHIGYNEVKVSKTNNGYSIYRYYGSNLWELNHDDVAYRNVANSTCDPNIPNMPAAPLPFEYKRGELKYEGHFNQGGQLLKSAQYNYDFDSSNIVTPGYIVQEIPVAGVLGTRYVVKSYWKKKTEITETNIASGISQQVVKTSYNESPNHFQVTRSTVNDSKGNVLESRYKYVNDFRVPDCDAIADGWQTYVSSCATCDATMLTQVSNCTTQYCAFWHTINNYICRANARKTFVTNRRNNFTNSSNLFKTNHDNAKSGADALFKPLLELQDRGINVPVETTSWKSGNLTGANFFVYGFTGSNVYPSKTQSINLSAPSSSFTTSSTTNTTLAKDSRYSDESSAKFDNGALVEVTGKDGVPVSYIWSTNNTLPIVKATGVDYATLKAAYASSGNNIGTIRNYLTGTNAFVSTYTYTPLVGIVTETNPVSRNLYYEYDKLGRLILIRDHDNNIIKKICYNYAGQPEDCSSPCTNANANWQNTATAVRCQLTAGQNTGYQEQEQKDINSCSLTYNQLRWVTTIYNTTACPLPATCSNCTGDDKKCINGTCETGTLKIVSTRRRKIFTDDGQGGYIISWEYYCSSAYCFSDHTTSTPVETQTSGLCTVDICQ